MEVTYAGKQQLLTSQYYYNPLQESQWQHCSGMENVFGPAWPNVFKQTCKSILKPFHLKYWYQSQIFWPYDKKTSWHECHNSMACQEARHDRSMVCLEATGVWRVRRLGTTGEWHARRLGTTDNEYKTVSSEKCPVIREVIMSQTRLKNKSTLAATPIWRVRVDDEIKAQWRYPAHCKHQMIFLLLVEAELSKHIKRSSRLVPLGDESHPGLPLWRQYDVQPGLPLWRQYDVQLSVWKFSIKPSVHREIARFTLSWSSSRGSSLTRSSLLSQISLSAFMCDKGKRRPLTCRRGTDKTATSYNHI